METFLTSLRGTNHMFGPGEVMSVEDGEGLVPALAPATAVRGLTLLPRLRLPLPRYANPASSPNSELLLLSRSLFQGHQIPWWFMTTSSKKPLNRKTS